MYIDDPREFKKGILSGVFSATIFSALVLAIFILFMKDDPSVEDGGEKLRRVLALVPLLISHVPWSAIRWSPRAKELRSENKLPFDLFSFLIDFGFVLTVFISLTFFFGLFNYPVIFSILLVSTVFYLMISTKILFFDFTPSHTS